MLEARKKIQFSKSLSWEESMRVLEKERKREKVCENDGVGVAVVCV